MSDGFAGSTTRTMGNFEREVERRMDGLRQDFLPPGAKEKVSGADFRKSENNYQDRHSDTSSRDSTSALAATGNAKDQKPLDDMDKEIQAYEAEIKKNPDAYGLRATLNRLGAGVDEALWDKAKRASQEAFGKIKWGFVQWWYSHHGDK